MRPLNLYALENNVTAVIGIPHSSYTIEMYISLIG